MYRVVKSSFLCSHHSHYLRYRCEKLRVGITHLFGDVAHHFRQRIDGAPHSSMPDSSSHNFAKDILPFSISRDYTVMNEKSSSARVICEDSQGGIKVGVIRSEERRVGKECRCRWSR